MICWQPGCRAVPVFTLRVDFRATPEEAPLMISLHTSLCEDHARATSVEEVLRSGLWDEVVATVRRRSLAPLQRELTTLELIPIFVGEC